jgi:protein farnesyltransferase/geranylgeranyltransferase type-1 subunit alpha
MNYFRAIFTKQEISERAFTMTQEAIFTSQGCYTAWSYRRKLLHALKKDLKDELNFCNSIGVQMQKNYQIWHHRRCIFEMYARQVARQVAKEQGEEEVDFAAMANDPTLKEMFQAEYEFLDIIFKYDAKNYHAWSHKYWLVERFSLAADQEHRLFIEQMLDEDVRNNSVWSFRYFVMARKNAMMPFMLHA